MSIRHAARMPEARSRLLGWLEGRRSGVLDPATTLWQPGRDAPPAIADLPEDDRGRGYAAWLAGVLRAANLYHVSADLTALAEHAGGSLPQHRLHQEMLPHTHGLLAWAEPIAGAAGIPVSGVAWAALLEGVWVEMLCDPGDLGHGHAQGESVRDAAAVAGWLGPDESMLLPWHMEWMIDGADHARGRAVATLMATWLLMGQTLVRVDEVEPRPADRRRLARRGDPPNATVSYVALRRQRTERRAAEDASGRDYRHQWLVSGHWRRQWYASVEQHRPIWISPHVKGPEGAPLLRSEHVYTLRR